MSALLFHGKIRGTKFMSVPERVTIYYEVNVREPDQMGSIWLLPGGDDPDKSLDEETRAVRIIGPVAPATAEAVADQLEKALTACGLVVLREFTADD